MPQLSKDTNYRALVEHIPAITYVAAWDDQSSTVYTSPQIEWLLGFTQSEWMADNTLWLAQIHPDDRAWVLEELERIHAGGEPVRIEYRMLTYDGREVWFRDDAAIARDADGKPLYLYRVMFDITIEKRLEFELADLRQRIGGLKPQHAPNISLTDRELEVLRLLAACWTNAKISTALHISTKTVEKHVGRIFEKLGVASRTEAALWATRVGLV